MNSKGVIKFIEQVMNVLLVDYFFIGLCNRCLWKLFDLVLTLHFYRETYRIMALYGPWLSVGLGALHMMPQDQW